MSERRRGELAGLARDAMLQGIAQGVSSVGYFVQIALITHVLGLAEFGRYALVIAAVTLVQQFVDVHVEQATITFGLRALREDVKQAAGIVQYSYIVDLVTGVAGFAIVAALAPVAGSRLVGGDGTLLLLLFATTLLTSTVDGTSGAVLRLFDRYGVIVANAIVREVLRVLFVGAALLFFEGLAPVFLAVLLHDVAGAFMLLWLASRTFRRRTGRPLRRSELAAARGQRRDMLRMVMHTNVSGYSRLAQRQLPPLLLGALIGPLEVGIYKIGTAAGQSVARLTDPVLRVTLPRLSRLWVDGHLDQLRHLLRQVAVLTIPAMVLAAAALIALRDPVLRLLGGPEAVAAGGVLALAAVAQALAGGFFWSGPLLLAAGRSGITARIQVIAVIVQIPAAYLLAHEFGAEGAAVALLGSYALVVSGYTWAALRTLRDPEAYRPSKTPEPAAMLAAPENLEPD